MYQAKKAKLLNEKADTKQEIRDFEQKGNNWLEPMREVILLCSQAKILLSQGDKAQIRAFLKNVGSNFMLNSKRLEISPKNGWIEFFNNFKFFNELRLIHFSKFFEKRKSVISPHQERKITLR